MGKGALQQNRGCQHWPRCSRPADCWRRRASQARAQMLHQCLLQLQQARQLPQALLLTAPPLLSAPLLSAPLTSRMMPASPQLLRLAARRVEAERSKAAARAARVQLLGLLVPRQQEATLALPAGRAAGAHLQLQPQQALPLPVPPLLLLVLLPQAQALLLVTSSPPLPPLYLPLLPLHPPVPQSWCCLMQTSSQSSDTPTQAA